MRTRDFLRAACACALACAGGGAAAAEEEKDAAREIAAAAHGNDIWLVAVIRQPGEEPRFGEPRNVTRRPGYDNQPFFLPDGNRFYYTSIREDGQADVWRYDIGAGESRRVTQTPQSEYSPTVPADGDGISVVRVDKDGRQELWRYGTDGKPGKILVEDEKAVGYHVWMDETTLALFIVGEPTVLKTVDLRSGRAREAGRDIGRSLQALPARPGVAYIEPGEGGERWIKLLQWPAGVVQPLTQPLEGSEDFLLSARDGELYMAQDRTLHVWARRPGAWRLVANWSEVLPGPVTRLAMSPRGDLLAIVVAESMPEPEPAE